MGMIGCLEVFGHELAKVLVHHGRSLVRELIELSAILSR